MRRRNASTGGRHFFSSTMDSNNDMRVKLKYHGEIRIIPISRPVMIDHLQRKISSVFSEDLCMHYEYGEVCAPILKQADLDKAIALLDQSQHLSSLRLTLTSSKTPSLSSESTLNGGLENGFHLTTDEHNKQIDNEIKNAFVGSRSFPTRYIRSRSNPEEIASSPEDDMLQFRSRSFRRVENNYSPPPGHHPIENRISSHNVQTGGGIFIPEDINDFDTTKEDGFISEENFRSPRRDSFDSVIDTSPSDSRMSIASENTHFYRQRHDIERRRPLSDVIPDTITALEFDFLPDGNRSEPFQINKVRPKSDWNLDHDFSDYVGTFRWVRGHENNFHQQMHRTTSSISVSHSSNSSDMVPDYDSRNDREIATLAQKLSFNNSESIHYKKLHQIGSGAFGTVFLCQDLDSGKEMAMKCVETGSVNPSSIKEVEILHKEINLYKSLNHERIVHYYGSMQDNKSLMIFMEYMEGGSLHDRISKFGALCENDVSKYCRQISEGLLYLHSKNIIHRDVKGANILLDKTGNCKLADFGASRQIQTIRSKTVCKSVHGTPYWMSPEVINGDGYGRKADIWSLGCTAIEMLTTKPPWFQYEPMAALFKIATQPTKVQLPNNISSTCQRFVDSCLQRDCSNRPSAADLLRDQFLIKR